MRRARILLAGSHLSRLPHAVPALERDRRVVQSAEESHAVDLHISTFRPDLVVLDLPDDAAAPVEPLVRRAQTPYRPLLLCTVADPAQEIAALEAGADACVSRPCSAHDLAVHVDALLRRATSLTRPVHQLGALVIDEAAAVALCDGQVLDLTAKEFAVLAHLVGNAGSVLSKRALLDALWDGAASDENLVEVHISAIRRRLPPSARSLIQTVRGMGYVARDDGAQEHPDQASQGGWT